MSHAEGTHTPSTEAAGAYPRFLHEHIEQMSPQHLLELQERRLLRQLAYTFERGKLVRSAWDAVKLRPEDVRSLDDFRAKVPFIDKAAIRNYRDTFGDTTGGLSCLGPGELRGIGTTSGTTGDPTPLVRNMRGVSDMMSLRDYWRIGVRPGDHMAHMLFSFRTGLNYRSIREHGIVPIYFTHSPHELPRLIEGSQRYRPTLLRNVSNPLLIALETLFEHTRQDPREVFSSYHGAVFGGEPLGARQKALAAAWGLEIFEQTTLGDICPATECHMHAGMHIHEDVAFVECLDPDGDTPVKDGEVGELVVTSLTDPAMPLIRFRTDDLVILDRQLCPCGVTHARFWPQARKTDQIVIDGTSILPRQVQPVVEGMSECRAGLFQVIRTSREMDRLRVRAGYDAGLLTGSPASLAERIREALEASLGVPADVEVTLNNELLKLGPPHKIPRVTTR